MTDIKQHTIQNYQTVKGAHYKTMSISFQVFGCEINTAPIVIVNHALTGDSDVASDKKGWWKQIVGNNKLINTNTYTVIAFNIPGNGVMGDIIPTYKDFCARDIALLFHIVLGELQIEKVHAIIGGSIGGGIAWEMACLFPNFSKYVIPIATDWKATDWIIGHNSIQENILLHSSHPLEDARKMALLFYRTPQSFSQKFDRTKTENEEIYAVESWLNHHAEKLKNRYKLEAYLMMNHLLSSINVVTKGKTIREVLSPIKSTVIQIGVESDLFFIPEENKKTQLILDELNISNQYYEIKSIHGHDAFLMEQEQISSFLSSIF